MAGLLNAAAYVLTKEMVLAGTNKETLNEVIHLNCWGVGLQDVTILEQLYNVEVLSLSVNEISSLKPMEKCFNLQELYLRKNCINDLHEIRYLRNLPDLRSLWLGDNKCTCMNGYRRLVIRALPQLERLDNIAITDKEREESIADQSENMLKFLASMELRMNLFDPMSNQRKRFGDRGEGYITPRSIADSENHVDEGFNSAIHLVSQTPDGVTPILSPVNSDDSMHVSASLITNCVVPYIGTIERRDMSPKSHSGSILPAVLMLIEDLDPDSLAQVSNRCAELTTIKYESQHN